MLWDKFEKLDPKQKGGQFEGLCFDLLTAMGFYVDRQSFSGKGGSDAGQDLILQHRDKETGKLTPVCIVECKFRTSATVNGSDLWSPLLAVLELNVPSFLIITSSELTSPLKSRFRSVSQNSRWGISFRRIERNHLESLIRKYPDASKKYFSDADLHENENNETDLAEPIVADLRAATMIEKDGQRMVEVTLHNTSAEDKEIRIEVSGQTKFTKLESFQEKTLSMRIKANFEGESLNVIDSDTSSTLLQLSTKPPSVPISHIFVDPYDYVQKISTSAKSGATVLISGRAGCGKSRVIYESATNFDYSCILDLSQDLGGVGLIGLLLEQIFKVPSGEIRGLPDKYIRGYLAKETELSENNLNALSAYIRQTQQDVSGYAEAAARLCAEWFENQLLAIDNIHRLTLFDLEFLQILSRHKGGMFLLLATRSEVGDFRESETLSFLDQHPGDNWEKFVIDETNTNRLLQTYIDRASKNQSTLDFLQPWKNVDSIQKFVLALKKLRAAGVLVQDFSGKFDIYSLKGAHPNQQRDIFDELKKLVARDLPRDLVERAIASAAIFGFQFPLSFVCDYAGLEAADVIDRLEELEIVSKQSSVDGELWFKFDHETTAELARKSVRTILSQSLHSKVLEYLEEKTRYKEGQDDKRIGDHLAALGFHLRSAEKYHSHAKFDAKRGRYRDSLSTLNVAKFAVDSITDTTDTRRLLLELQIIHDFLEFSLIGSEAYERRWQMLGAYKIALMLVGEENQGRHRGRYWFFKAQLERDGHPNEAEVSIKRSLSLFDDQNIKDKAESHAWLSNLLKRRGASRFSEALSHARIALSLTRGLPDKSLRSRCLLHTGALFLEHGRAQKTPWWWNQAVEALSGSSDLGTLAFAQTDLAYIHALVRPKHPETKLNLAASRSLAKQFDLIDIEVRAAINMANWVYFYDFNEIVCLELIHEAQAKIDIFSEVYKQSLLDFSCLNFKELSSKLNIDKCELRLLNFLEHWFSDSVKTVDGDRRIQNMLEFFYRKEEPKVIQILENLKDVSIARAVESTQSNNIYYFSISKSYATYY